MVERRCSHWGLELGLESSHLQRGKANKASRGQAPKRKGSKEERLQQKQKKELWQELQLVRKLGVARAHAAEREQKKDEAVLAKRAPVLEVPLVAIAPWIRAGKIARKKAKRTTAVSLKRHVHGIRALRKTFGKGGEAWRATNW